MTIVLPFTSSDQPRAERLLDLIHWFGGAQHCLLVPTPDVGPEIKTKTQLAAEAGFHTVEMLPITNLPGTEKTLRINSLFKQVRDFIADAYKEPWMWLEPTCVPLKPSWLCTIEDQYQNQPRRYLGAFMKGSNGMFMHKVAVYPADASDVICDGSGPFWRVSPLVLKAYKSNLIRVEKWKEGFKTDAVLLDGDPTGKLVEQLIDAASKPFVGQTRLVKSAERAKSAA